MPAAAGAAGGSDPRAYLDNRAGISSFGAQRFPEATNDFAEALRREPLAGELHYNLGLVFLQRQENDKARESFRLALEHARDDETRFRARFNLGVILGAEKKYEAALEQYQEALFFHPDSFETKINIELLVAQKDQQDQKDKDQKEKDQKEKDQQDPKQKDQQDPKKKDQDKKDGKGEKDPKDQKDDKDKGKGQQEKSEPDKGKDQQKKPGEYEKPKPQEFKSQELTPGDVNKILDEIKQQEQRIRADYQRKETKERPREKPW